LFAYLVPCLAAFFLVYVLMPAANRLAWRTNLLDMPVGRKSHARPMPLSGGLAMYIGVAVVTSFFVGMQKLVAVLIAGGALLVGIGCLDDWYKSRRRELPVLPKLLVQLFTAMLAFAMEIRFRGFSLSWLGGDQFIVFPAWLSFLATVLWIVGLINMVNFLDGMDGLAAGVTTFSAIALFFLAYGKGQGVTALIAVALVGAALAFLRFNFYPAEMFMGDAGAMFLGFALALVSLEGAMKGATLISLAVTLLALGLPVMDTLQVMVSRLLAGKPMYQADRRHVHHRLLSKGLSVKQTVFVIYFISLLFSVVSVWLFWLIS
jgi:UDP-GlcNAc:undecaprenyl-phosphate GlcNAc-1-phosphate transferase